VLPLRYGDQLFDNDEYHCARREGEGVWEEGTNKRYRQRTHDPKYRFNQPRRLAVPTLPRENPSRLSGTDTDVPSGNFCSLIPSARAPTSEADGIFAATAPKATPTASLFLLVCCGQ